MTLLQRIGVDPVIDLEEREAPDDDYPQGKSSDSTSLIRGLQNELSTLAAELHEARREHAEQSAIAAAASASALNEIKAEIGALAKLVRREARESRVRALRSQASIFEPNDPRVKVPLDASAVKVYAATYGRDPQLREIVAECSKSEVSADPGKVQAAIRGFVKHVMHTYGEGKQTLR